MSGTYFLQDKSGFDMFSTSYGPGAVLFSESSTTFLEVESEDPKTWMGHMYHNAMKAMDCKAEGEFYLSSFTPCVLFDMLMHHFPFLPLTHLFANILEVLRWCVVSSGEQQKCGDMGSAFKSKGLTPSIQCVYGESVTDCMAKIKVTSVFFLPPLKWLVFIPLKFKEEMND